MSFFLVVFHFCSKKKKTEKRKKEKKKKRKKEQRKEKQKKKTSPQPFINIFFWNLTPGTYKSKYHDDDEEDDEEDDDDEEEEGDDEDHHNGRRIRMEAPREDVDIIQLIVFFCNNSEAKLDLPSLPPAFRIGPIR